MTRPSKRRARRAGVTRRQALRAGAAALLALTGAGCSGKSGAPGGRTSPRKPTVEDFKHPPAASVNAQYPVSFNAAKDNPAEIGYAVYDSSLIIDNKLKKKKYSRLLREPGTMKPGDSKLVKFTPQATGTMTLTLLAWDRTNKPRPSDKMSDYLLIQHVPVTVS